MRKLVFCLLLTTIISCNTGTKQETSSSTDSTKTKPTVAMTYPYTADYSSSFEIGDPKNSETILKIWKAWDDDNFESVKDLFADSVRMFFRGGMQAVATRDSALAIAKAARESLASSKDFVHAFMSLRSTDKNENWVCVWGKEIDTDKKGKVDSVELQETWRLNKDGKADLVYQYGQSFPAPSKK